MHVFSGMYFAPQSWLGSYAYADLIRFRIPITWIENHVQVIDNKVIIKDLQHTSKRLAKLSCEIFIPGINLKVVTKVRSLAVYVTVR